MDPALRFLIVRTDAVGDNVVSLPVAADIKATVPAARISWIAKPAVAPLIRLDRHVDAVIEWNDALIPRPCCRS